MPVSAAVSAALRWFLLDEQSVYEEGFKALALEGGMTLILLGPLDPYVKSDNKVPACNSKVLVSAAVSAASRYHVV